MIAVITGDIMNSREVVPSIWLESLKGVLLLYGDEPSAWEIYRGDSFQLKLSPDKALRCALHIKSAIKQHDLLDVRMAIGFGEESHHAEKITESNGTAYLNSGNCFESLKKETLAVASMNKVLDERLNLMLSLLLLTANQWSKTVSKVLCAAFEHPNLPQVELAALLDKSQSSISEALKRGAYDEILKLNELFQAEIKSSL